MTGIPEDDEARWAAFARDPEGTETAELVGLGRDLAMLHWRAGPGRVEAGPPLDRAIAVLEELYRRVEPAEAIRERTAALLGWLLGVRHLAHRGATADRTRAIGLLEEAVASARLEPALAVNARLTLGQLLLRRAGRAVPRSGSGAGSRSVDVARATALFDEVARDPRAPAEAVEAARVLLGAAAPLPGAGGSPGERLARAGTAFRSWRRLARYAPGGVLPLLRPGDALARAHPLDRPGATSVGTIDVPPAETRTPPPGETPTQPSGATRRREAARAVMPAVSIDAEPSTLDAGRIAHFVARAAYLCEAPDAGDADRLLHAIGLYWRAVVEGDGWSDKSRPSPVDLHAAATLLGRLDLAAAPRTLADDASRLATLIAALDPTLVVNVGRDGR